MSSLDATAATVRQGPMCAMRTPLLSKQAAVTSSHSLPYVLPSEPQTGNNWLELGSVQLELMHS